MKLSKSEKRLVARISFSAVLVFFIVVAIIRTNILADIKTGANIIWAGHPVISDNDKWTPSQAWLPDVVIGLRDDGVVVWKKVEKEN